MIGKDGSISGIRTRGPWEDKATKLFLSRNSRISNPNSIFNK